MKSTKPTSEKLPNIIRKNFRPLYQEIGRSWNPKTAVSQALENVSLYRVVDFIIDLTDSWYRQLMELQTAQDELDWRVS
jgi:hypothetical protein